MLATLALAALLSAPQPAAPALSPQMAEQLSLATQQYGPPPTNPAPAPPPPTNEQQNSNTGIFLTPTDDIWVYPTAEDPQKDQYLQAWGSNGKSVPVPGDDPKASSWSLLKWDLSGFPEGAKIVQAELILTAAPDSGFTAKDAAAAPLEVRAVKSSFSEQNWDFATASNFMPQDDTGLFSTAAPANITSTGFPIVIDLLKGPADFRAYYADAMKKSKVIALALTSRMDPSTAGKGAFYKLYSKDATDPSVQPRLRLVLLNPEKTKRRRRG